MAQKTESLLRKVVAQIRSGKVNKARPVLVDLLRREPNNEQAWYLLSFVLEDPQQQQYALLQAIKINAEFEKARKRLGKLRGEPEESAKPFVETPEPATEPVPVESSPEDQLRSAPTFVEETSDEKTSSEQIEAIIRSEPFEKKPRSRSFLRAFSIIVILLVVAVLAYFAATTFLPGVGIPTATPTVLASRTLPATWTPTLQSTATATIAPTRTPSPTQAPTETISGSDTATP